MIHLSKDVATESSFMNLACDFTKFDGVMKIFAKLSWIRLAEVCAETSSNRMDVR